MCENCSGELKLVGDLDKGSLYRQTLTSEVGPDNEHSRNEASQQYLRHQYYAAHYTGRGPLELKVSTKGRSYATAAKQMLYYPDRTRGSRQIRAMKLPIRVYTRMYNIYYFPSWVDQRIVDILNWLREISDRF